MAICAYVPLDHPLTTPPFSAGLCLPLSRCFAERSLLPQCIGSGVTLQLLCLSYASAQCTFYPCPSLVLLLELYALLFCTLCQHRHVLRSWPQCQPSSCSC